MDTKNLKICGPRPDFYRENYLLLNGEWDFAFDDNNVGIKERWYLKVSEIYCQQRI